MCDLKWIAPNEDKYLLDYGIQFIHEEKKDLGENATLEVNIAVDRGSRFYESMCSLETVVYDLSDESDGIEVFLPNVAVAAGHQVDVLDTRCGGSR